MAIAALAAAAPGPAAPAKAEKTREAAQSPRPRAGEWPFYGGTLNNHREQLKEKSIDTGNVSELGVAWQTTTPDGGLIHSTPIVANGCVFIGTELGNVYALNVKTGKVVWKRSVGKSEGSNIAEGAGIVGAPAVVGKLVYVGATTPKGSVLSALDRRTGKVVWKRVVDKDEGGGLDSSPVPFKGMVFQAFKGDESSDHSWPGFVIVDGSRKGRGKILVKTHNIPKKDFKAGYRGGSTINTPAVDLKKMLVFAGHRQPGQPEAASDHQLAAQDQRQSRSRRSSGRSWPTIAAPRTAIRLPQDIDSPTCQSDLQWPAGRFSCAQFDFNFLASPNLWTNSEGRQMFGGLQKSGVFTAVYTDTMEEAWQATIGMPCFGCNLSSSAVDKNGIYVAVTGGNLYSLNRDTGAVQWATPMTGGMRYNGVAVANGIVYSLNDAVGALQAFDASSGAQLLSHSFQEDTGESMHDMGNSSGVSVARNMVFATAQSGGTSTLFALKRGATGDPDGGDDGGGGGGGGEQPPWRAAAGRRRRLGSEAIIATGPGAQSYGYLTPIVTINKGGTASYTNCDAVKHNVSSPDGLFRSELADSGATVPVDGVEKLEPGTYEFLCEPHPNMKGELTVR